MIIKSYASSSKGNLYSLCDGRTSVLLEAGIRFSILRQAVNYKLSEFAACLCSHEHGDHARSVYDLLTSGMDVFMSGGTADALDLKHHRLHIIRAREEIQIGSLVIMPFETQHDAEEPLGFLICSRESKEKLLFATDTYYIRYHFSGLNYIMIECNYELRILNDNVTKGLIPEAHKNRVLKSHFALENVLKFLDVTDLSKVKKIYLLHLSEGNSNAERFQEIIEKRFYRPVEVCAEQEHLRS